MITRPSRTAGYTLLELLIVMTLIGVLMLGVWSLLRNWGGLYERGEKRTRHSQLARSLCDQLTDDLHDVTYRPPARRRRRASETPAPSGIGLVGEKDWMVLDVLQPVNPFHAARAASDEMAGEPKQPAVWVPEVQRVIYRFYSRDETTEQPLLGEEEAPAFFGMIRVGIAREYYSELTAVEGGGSGNPTRGGSTLVSEVDQICQAIVDPEETDALLGQTLPAAGDDTENADMGRPEWLPGVMQQDEVPEVGWLEFRYFNGSGWQDRWDSRTQGRLPVAVEVRFELMEPPSDEESALTEEEQAEAELLEADESDYSRETALLEGDQPDWAGQDEMLDVTGAADEESVPYFRCVVYLEPPKEWPTPTEDDELVSEPDPAEAAATE